MATSQNNSDDYNDREDVYSYTNSSNRVVHGSQHEVFEDGNSDSSEESNDVSQPDQYGRVLIEPYKYNVDLLRAECRRRDIVVYRSPHPLKNDTKKEVLELLRKFDKEKVVYDVYSNQDVLALGPTKPSSIRRTKHCYYRTINVILGPKMKGRLREIFGSPSREELDAGLIQGNQNAFLS